MAQQTIEIFGAMVGPPPSFGLTGRLHDLDVQILGQSKSGPAGTKALNQAIERIWLVNQPRISDWGLAVGSK
ncbi:hypothetical protein, partial [Stenotrophomonas maltophilia]|uniref:hypothetical protein n=1 Tax=Stenotrophomonas maltophilia TaxID=40324 RepID=UPI001952FDAE